MPGGGPAGTPLCAATAGASEKVLIYYTKKSGFSKAAG